MRRRFETLHQFGDPINQVPNGVFLVRVQHAQYASAKKPFYALRLLVVEPEEFAARPIVGRLYSTDRAMWKLYWFLRDFGYDPDLLARGEIDDQRLRGLQGVVQVAHTVIHGRPAMDLVGFAPVARWAELSQTQDWAEEAS